MTARRLHLNAPVKSADHIYLDYHATTPCDARVVEAMQPTFTHVFGNAASQQHAFGAEAAELVAAARRSVAQLLECDPREVVFTSGATESDNLAVRGVVARSPHRRPHVVTSALEHKAVLDACGRLERQGCEVTYLKPESDGRIDVEAVANAMNERTALVTLMLANNEIGTLNPIAEVGLLCRQRGVPLHTDAAQAATYIDVSVERLSVDLLSLSGHKMYGPKGVGALYVRRRRPRVRLEPLIDGGGHERGMRSGTLNVSGIVGLGKACEIASAQRQADAQQAQRLRDELLAALQGALDGVVLNGSLEQRLPNNLNVSFAGVDAQALLGALDCVAASSGAACSSASSDGSYVLKALFGDDVRARSSVRLSLGRPTTSREIKLAAARIVDAVKRVRAAASQGGSTPMDASCLPASGSCG